MAKLFGILTAIVLASSGFVAFKNKGAYETTIANTQVEKDKLVTSEARLTAAKGVLEELPVQCAAVDAQADTLTASAATEEKANEDAKTANTATAAKVAGNKEKLDEFREKTSKMGDLKELASKMRTTSTELEELTQSISTSEAKLANLTAQSNSTNVQVSDAKSKMDSFSSSQSLPSLKTRIRSIYPNWGFVTLASGNNAGVVTNSTLNVVRGDQTIAKLLVTAVESSSSSASIIPESLASDVTLSVGDHVVPASPMAKTISN
jgi:hypothetical protein